MTTEENNLRRRTRMSMAWGFMLRRKVLAWIALLLMGASLIFTPSTSAHNIDVKKAREVAREYARAIRDQSNGNYKHYSTNCVAAFPNHNHIVRCLIDFQNAKDSAAGVYTCRERIELYLDSHGRSDSYNYGVKIRQASGTRC